MEARGAAERFGFTERVPAWLLGVIPLVLLAIAATVYAGLGAPGLGDRDRPPVENLVVERTVLHPGQIDLRVRNDGPDSVRLAQVAVNDAYVNFSSAEQEIGRLGSDKLTIDYPWIEGEDYEISMVTSNGATIKHAIHGAVETPANDIGFFGLMILLGLYVGVIPVGLGMLWLPFVRRIGREWVRGLMALTIGLLLFLAIDAGLEGIDVAQAGAQRLGGVLLVFLGATVSYLLLAAVEASLRARQERARAGGAAGAYLALLVAIGIGLHNLGEGLAIGSAYAVGALALGAFLVIGFAIHNTTEGLAIVAPVAAHPPTLRRLGGLGLIAGAPVILGTWLGAAAYNASLAAFLLGVGAGAIAQVILQLLPTIRDDGGRTLYPLSVMGIIAGLTTLYFTGLLVNV
jgi:ZIP family zinc transporter